MPGANAAHSLLPASGQTGPKIIYCGSHHIQVPALQQGYVIDVYAPDFCPAVQIKLAKAC